MGPGYKTVAIFGGTGFIGGQIVRALARQGYIVKIGCRVPERAYDLKPCGHVGQIVPVACDFKNPQSIDTIVRGSDMVINCLGTFDTRAFRMLHEAVPHDIAESCARHTVSRFVHISALGVTHGDSRYACSKRKGEDAVLSAFPSTTILRPGVVFGPDDSFFNKFAGLARLLPFLPLIGGGKTKLQPVYVGDLVESVMAVLAIPDGSTADPRGRIYECGGPEVTDFRRIYGLLAHYTGRARCLLPLPWFIAKMQGAVLGLLPGRILTMDQVETLKTDSVVTPGALTLHDLGVEPAAMETILPTYLSRFRSGGPFRTLEKARS